MRIRRLLPLAVIAGIAVSCGAASAAGGGALSSSEFQQLQALQSRLKTVKATSLKGYQSMLVACEETQMETPLLIQMRSFCDDYAQMSIEGLQINKPGSAFYVCIARARSAKARLNCAATTYSKWYPSMAGLYSSDVSILHLATARKLGARCIEFLAGSSEQITDASKLVNAMQLTIAEARAGSLTAFEADNKIFVADTDRLNSALSQGPSKLSACRHR